MFPLVFLIAIHQLTGKRGVPSKLRAPRLSGWLGRFAHEDVFGDAVRRAAWLCGLMRPVSTYLVALFPEAADGIWWLDNIQILRRFNGRYWAVSQRLHHLAVLISRNVACHSLSLTLVLSSVFSLGRCSSTALAISRAALRNPHSLFISHFTVRRLLLRAR